MRTLNILSIDLDWFNYISETGIYQGEVSERVGDFFRKLSRRCTLPIKIAWMKEHQYLYPWTLRLLRSRKAKRVNVTNVDEHHDFYHLSEIDDFKSSDISCADFFGFMVYDGILNSYDWVNNGMTHTNAQGVRDILNELDASRDPKLKKWADEQSFRLNVRSRSKVWEAVSGLVFDGVAIIESAEYTRSLTTVVRAAKKALKDEGFDLKEHRCTADFRYSQRKKIDMRPIFRVATMA